ncbi:hypothetical protein GCM10011577_29970 [Pseudarthrobacter polychromogenes]|uniref:Uncharacterized protein n=1 Tax=Pseudarthrobacter polychromogenes TaxID=1676 RepID=A0ABQ1XUQ5_9MICC|nr:hypothetical protein GCM10011577_29970 [Pseudarthrobacter polychromogenes]
MEPLVAMEEDLQDANAYQRQAGGSGEYLAQHIHAALLAQPCSLRFLRAGYASGAKTFKGRIANTVHYPLPMPARLQPGPNRPP